MVHAINTHPLTCHPPTAVRRQWAVALSVVVGMSASITGWEVQPFPSSEARRGASRLGTGSVGRKGRVRIHGIHVDANQVTRLKLHATLTAQLHTPHTCYDWGICSTMRDAVARETPRIASTSDMWATQA